MTLDNGIQSVTIDPIAIKSTNPGVHQEFELVVGSDLQFILTFHAQMDALTDPDAELQKEDSPEPESEAEQRESPQPELPAPEQKLQTPPVSPKKSKFRLFGSSSPKKAHKQTTMASQRAQSASPTKRAGTPGSNTQSPRLSKTNSTDSASRQKPRDMWDGLIGPEGEFGRCYLVASQYENEVYGRSRTFNLSLFNEWGWYEEVEEDPTAPAPGQPSLASLVPTANGSAGHHNYANRKNEKYNQTKNMLQRSDLGANRPRKVKKVSLEPFKIATVQVTLMYIPRVTMASPIPTSIKNAVREFGLVQSYKNLHLEGYLSQEGGDCNYWRRRLFVLHSETLTGYTEESHKVRSVVHLSNVKSVVDVATMSASERSELYGVVMYQDRSFRLTFKDGEVINFYADNAKTKDEWVRALLIACTYGTGRAYTWVDKVIDRITEEKKIEAARYRHPANMKAPNGSALTSGSKSRRKGKAKKASFSDNVEILES